MAPHQCLISAVLVDNTRSAEQVQPLVPATARGTILATSRHRLAGLALAGFLDLDCFPTATGAALLAGLLDEDRRPPGEDLLHALATRCHGHPLALTIAGAHLAAHPRRDPARLITRLTHLAEASAAALDLHELSVEGVMEMSYEDLDATTARLYRGLAEHPAAEFTAEPLAAGLDVPISEVDCGLGRLVEANWSPRPATSATDCTTSYTSTCRPSPTRTTRASGWRSVAG